MKDTTYLLKHIDDFVHEAMMKIAWQKYKKAEEICKNEIDRFYREYSPDKDKKVRLRNGYAYKMVYKRKYDLKNVYNLDVTKNGDFIFELGSEFMKKKHRVDNEYIYEKMFEEGWHGGAHDGPGHPNPGKNYWRTPSVDDEEHGIKAYSYWWDKPAAKSTSPYENIINKWNSYMNGQGKKMELETWALTTKKYLTRR